MKGARVGGAGVSEKHANFILNTGNATAVDIESLILRVADAVDQRHGIRLQPEGTDCRRKGRSIAMTHSRKIENPAAFGKVGVLMGGAFGEREISLKGGDAVLSALQSRDVNAVWCRCG